MRYSGFANFLDLDRMTSLILSAAIGLLVFTSSALATPPAFGDEVKQLIREATKLTRSGKLPEAEATLRRAVSIDTKRSDAKLALAYVLTKERRLADAYEIALPIAQAEPKNARAFSVLGATYLTGGRFREAGALFLKAISLDSREHLAWGGLGLLNFYENSIDLSLSQLQQAVYLEPNEPDYLFALGQVAARAEKYQDAAEAYEDFLNISNNADADRRARIKGLIHFLNFLSGAGKLYTLAGLEQTSVPFELIGNRPIIRLYINGKPEPLRFVLDTGSGISVISDETAKRLKIKQVSKGGFARGLGGNGKFEIVYGLLKELRIGEVALKQVPVYLRKFHSDVQGQPLDGYIGLGLISKFLTTIDYGNQTFSLTRKDADVRGFTEATNALSMPLRLTSSGFLSGEVQLDGIESALNFIVDTGASVSVISGEVARAEGISPFANDERLTVIGSAGVTDDVQTFRLPRISFGKHSRTDVTAVALDLDLINEASGFQQSGILGGNFLKNYRLTFDFKNSKVTFVSVKPEKE